MRKKVEKILKEKNIYIFPPLKKFKEVMMLTYDDLEDLDFETLDRYIYVLSQYITYLAQQRNFYKIEENYLRDQYEKKLMARVADIKAKTLKEKKALAAQDPEIKEIEKKYKLIKSIRESLHEMPEYHREILNALKRIQSDLISERRES